MINIPFIDNFLINHREKPTSYITACMKEKYLKNLGKERKVTKNTSNKTWKI